MNVNKYTTNSLWRRAILLLLPLILESACADDASPSGNCTVSREGTKTVQTCTFPSVFLDNSINDYTEYFQANLCPVSYELLKIHFLNVQKMVDNIFAHAWNAPSNESSQEVLLSDFFEHLGQCDRYTYMGSYAYHHSDPATYPLLDYCRTEGIKGYVNGFRRLDAENGIVEFRRIDLEVKPNFFHRSPWFTLRLEGSFGSGMYFTVHSPAPVSLYQGTVSLSPGQEMPEAPGSGQDQSPLSPEYPELLLLLKLDTGESRIGMQYDYKIHQYPLEAAPEETNTIGFYNLRKPDTGEQISYDLANITTVQQGRLNQTRLLRLDREFTEEGRDLLTIELALPVSLLTESDSLLLGIEKLRRAAIEGSGDCGEHATPVTCIITQEPYQGICFDGRFSLLTDSTTATEMPTTGSTATATTPASLPLFLCLMFLDLLHFRTSFLHFLY